MKKIDLAELPVQILIVAFIAWGITVYAEAFFAFVAWIFHGIVGLFG